MQPRRSSSGFGVASPVSAASRSSPPGSFRSPGTTSADTIGVVGGHLRAVADQSEEFVARTPDPSPGPERRAVSSDLLDRVTAAMDELPEHYRIVVWLRDGEDLSYSEIADVLDLPVGTVRSRLARARDGSQEGGWSVMDETLRELVSRYIDGDLDDAESARLETRAHTDAELAAEIDAAPTAPGGRRSARRKDGTTGDAGQGDGTPPTERTRSRSLGSAGLSAGSARQRRWFSGSRWRWRWPVATPSRR